jgi:predicted nuclease of predicted toxin-antitoxin system
MQLLIDEHLSPRLVQWCADRRNPPLYAVSVAHCRLSGQPDAVVWGYALEHDFVVVTTNARDFLHISAQSDPESFMVNRVLEVLSPGQVISREIPTT